MANAKKHSLPATKEDRDAAAAIHVKNGCSHLLAGDDLDDDDFIVQAFASHRLAYELTYAARVAYEGRILAAQIVAMRLKRLIPEPGGRGSYKGDNFYPVGGVEASHEWDGERWHWLSSLAIDA